MAKSASALHRTRVFIGWPKDGRRTNRLVAPLRVFRPLIFNLREGKPAAPLTARSPARWAATRQAEVLLHLKSFPPAWPSSRSSIPATYPVLLVTPTPRSEQGL